MEKKPIYVSPEEYENEEWQLRRYTIELAEHWSAWGRAMYARRQALHAPRHRMDVYNTGITDRETLAQYWLDIIRSERAAIFPLMKLIRDLEDEISRKVKVELMYRLSAAINRIPIHRKYYSTIIQAWFQTREEAEEWIDTALDLLLAFTEEMIGYMQEEWWVGSTKTGEDTFGIDTPAEIAKGIQEEKFDERVFKTYELRFEDENGNAIETRTGYID